MGIFDGCLIVSDIDGTLLCDGKIPQKNLDAIEWFKSEGGIFSLATGRAVMAARYSYDLARSKAPLMAIHGGIVYDYESEKMLYHCTLDDGVKDILFDILKRFKNIGAELFSGLKIYELRSNEGTRWHRDYEELVFSPVPEDLNSVPWSKILFAIDTEQEVEQLKSYCEGLNVDICRFINTCNKENARYYEILPKEVNKGTALMEMKKLLKVKRTYGIGDFYNDIELIRDADVGATVAGAPNELKELADYVTCPCEDGAVADFINKIALEMKGSIVWRK